jgi:HEPN domain-containing protein
MTFDVDKTIKFWAESAIYDLETRKSLLESKRYPYALFFGHLALEKILKAFAVKATAEHAPFTHSLTFLASKTGIDIPESILDKLAEYTEFHLSSSDQPLIDLFNFSKFLAGKFLCALLIKSFFSSGYLDSRWNSIYSAS